MLLTSEARTESRERELKRVPRVLRRDVLNMATGVATWIAVPITGLYVLIAWRTGRSNFWQVPEFLAMTAMAILPRLAADQPIRVARRAFVVSFGLSTLFAVLHYGPNFGLGVMYVTWLLAFIFFERHWVLASSIGTAAFLVVGFGTSEGVIWTPWFSTGPSLVAWLRMAISVGVMSAAIGFMFDRVLDGLEASLESEIEARAAEAAAQADREAALTALAANQRIESLGRLAGGVAHDFNNALGVLALGLDALDAETDRAERAQSMEIMRGAMRGARETTRQLLSFSRQGSAPGSVSHASEVIAGMGRSLVRVFPASMRIVTEARTVGRVTLGVGELEQAILNLCLNARDAMRGEGTLTLRTMTSERNETEMLIEVEDTGDGMTEEVRRRALDPFFTTKESTGGTGLGLAMVHATARRAGGSVEIDSAPGRGTTVRLRLPLAVEAQEPHLVEPPSISAPRARRILYVEDEPALVRMTARSLGREGHEVAIATTVAEGIDRLTAGPLPDLLLTDARLPDGSCAPVIREFRRLKPCGPVILCSGYVEDEAVVGGIERDSVVFLQKPYGIKVLVDAVEEVLADPAVTKRGQTA
ncbi:MAG: response regulator [Gemmatimonadetes bacterium]|nr:response regulator [Gemmatimonadota bacterium]